MAKIQRTNAVGLDKAISAHQDHLFNGLSITGFVNADSWQSYDRAYGNPHENGIIPEVFTGGQEYKEVFYNDNFLMTSFYFMKDTGRMEDGQILVDVDLIVQANIEDIYPLIDHRADEELRQIFMFLSESFSGADNFEFKNFYTRIDEVYREFVQRQIKIDDMSGQHVFRLKYEVRYTPECCTTC